MTVLVLGATGMTGRELVAQLLRRDHKVRAVVRSAKKLSAEALHHSNMTVIEASVLDLTDDEMAHHAKNCEAVVSCLGHVADLRGLFGEPRRLCTDAVRRMTNAIVENRPNQPTRFILMNTVGVPNPDLDETRTWVERGLLALLRRTVPPHRDNETAAEYLRNGVGRRNRYVEWCSVRPDSLVNADISAYDIEPSPTTGIFSGRPTTRANVAHFMVELIEDAELWSVWRFGMPVIMNAT